MAPENHPNRLLASLTKADFDLMHPHLKPITLDQQATLFSTGDTLERVYFPHSGIISLVVDLASGDIVEAAMIGRDSMVGAASALDGQISINKAIVQLAGAGSTLDVSRFRKLADQSASFRITLIRHEETLFAQAQQSVACNATHTLEARLARWLLRARDLSDDDNLDLTQEFLAQMLAAHQRFCHRPHAAKGGVHPVQPGSHQNHKCRWPAGRGLRVLRNSQKEL